MLEIGEADYFSPESIAGSGQMFRFVQENGKTVFFSKNDAAKVVKSAEKYVIISSNEAYFREYFDLGADYARKAKRLAALPQLAPAFAFGRGMRILKQDPFETLVGFLISQNNHIPRIRGIMERLCAALGEEREFADVRYFGFPSAERMAGAGEDFYRRIGAGYRAPYLDRAARLAAETDFEALKALPDGELAERILAFPGVGPKVRDCVLLFGFGRGGRFPVDTWIEKVYHESFGGTERSRVKMTAFFEQAFGEDSGFVQQMLFYYARNKNKIGGQPI